MGKTKQILFGDIKLRFGKHKGQTLDSVPNDYLLWCIEKNTLKGKTLFYAKSKLHYPLDKYQITVKDSLNADGIYIIEAYNKTHALNECLRINDIQGSQSGTTYTITLI